jgi:uncharacterized protein YciI
MKILMFYEVTPEGLARAAAHYPAHVARLQEFHARGELLMAGPYGNPPVGAVGVFTSRKAAENFLRGDPFVQNGIVERYRLEDWNEVLHVVRP